MYCHREGGTRQYHMGDVFGSKQRLQLKTAVSSSDLHVLLHSSASLKDGLNWWFRHRAAVSCRATQCCLCNPTCLLVERSWGGGGLASHLGSLWSAARGANWLIAMDLPLPLF